MNMACPYHINGLTLIPLQAVLNSTVPDVDLLERVGYTRQPGFRKVLNFALTPRNRLIKKTPPL